MGAGGGEGGGRGILNNMAKLNKLLLKKSVINRYKLKPKKSLFSWNKSKISLT